MTPEQWQEIKTSLHAALELEPEKRSVYIVGIVHAHPELRQEIQSLLASSLQMKTDFLDAAGTTVRDRGSDTQESLVGRKLGPYRVVELVGRGGMGEVFSAVRADDHYQKRVAIKLVRAGANSAFVVSRFRNERQILASLDHPNMARLVDGGASEDGIPYLVMELVEGIPIDAYCDKHKLTTTERLKLFLQVCSAVQYAHQRLIIHRDIKPSNILVTGDGAPKLLDFGIAKILDPGTLGGNVENTMTLFRLFTPGYASPEQVRGDPITTASDVYSLGVILYELLTGRSPYGRRKTSGELTRAVCEFDPERPSTIVTRSSTDDESEPILAEKISSVREGSPNKLRKRLRGDLDNIVLMALRKEPERRYSSVEVLAADISRHLQDLPVVARGDSARYRACKFVVRHKAAVSAVIAASLALVVGLAIAVREARIARAERVRAEQRFKDVRELANSDLFELHDAIQQLPGSASIRNMVIQRALKYLEKLSRDAAGDRQLMRELATGYERVAALQGNFSGSGIGDTASALVSYEKALKLREALFATSRDDFNERMAQVKSMGAYLQALDVAGKTGVAKKVAEQAVAISNEVMKAHTLDAAEQLTAAYANLQLAIVLGGDGSSSSVREIEEAIERDRQAIRILEPLAAQSQSARAFLPKAELLLAFHFSKNREFKESETAFGNALSIASNGPVAGHIYVGDVYGFRGIMFERSGDQLSALEDYEKLKTISESVVKSNPDDLNEQQRLQISRAHVTVQKFRLGVKRIDPRALDSAVAVGERMFAADPSQLFYRNLLSGGYCYQGELALIQHKFSEATKIYTKAFELEKSIARDDPDDLESHIGMAKIEDAVGVVAAEAGKSREAQQQFDLAQQRLRDLLQIRPRDAEATYVSGLVQTHKVQLESCSRSRNCGIARWQLPPVLN